MDGAAFFLSHLSEFVKNIQLNLWWNLSFVKIFLEPAGK